MGSDKRNLAKTLEILLGLEPGFLSRQGEFSINFNPQWPWQATTGAAMWNLVLAALALALVIWVYRREGRSRGVKISLGIIRGLLLAFTIAMLNRPVLTLGQNRTEPSVLAVLIDDSISMHLRDAGDPKDPSSRLQAVQSLLDSTASLPTALTKQHQLRFYRFDTTAEPVNGPLDKLEPTGQNTQVEKSVRSVMEDLQGQRLAGVVVFTDGRDTPTSPLADTLAAVKDFGVKVYPVPVGSEKPPSNIDVQSVNVQDSAFKGDIVNVKVTVRGTGYEPNHPVTLTLKDKKSGKPLTAPNGNSGVEQRITLPDDNPVEAELQFKATDTGPLDLVVEAVKQPAETDDQDNIRTAQITVLDAQISVLYVGFGGLLSGFDDEIERAGVGGFELKLGFDGVVIGKRDALLDAGVSVGGGEGLAAFFIFECQRDRVIGFVTGAAHGDLYIHDVALEGVVPGR